MAKISTLLFLFACAYALVQSAAPVATQAASLSPVESLRVLKSGGGGGRPSGGRPSGGRPSGNRPSGNRPSGNRPSGNRPSTSTANGSPGGGVIVGSSVASGTYVGSRPYTSTYSTGHRGNNHTKSDEIVFAGDGGSVPASLAVGPASTFTGGVTVATAVVLVFAQGL